jgi:hypothetical protein
VVRTPSAASAGTGYLIINAEGVSYLARFREKVTSGNRCIDRLNPPDYQSQGAVAEFQL